MKPILFLSVLFLSACGAFKVSDSSVPSRSIASVNETESSLMQNLEEKLQHIHFYNLMGQKQLQLFDQQINSLELEKLYQSQVYLKLQAIRSQVEEVEHEIIELMSNLDQDKSNRDHQHKRLAIILKISSFAKTSRVHAYSMENLTSALGIDKQQIFVEVNKLKAQKALAPLEIDQEIEKSRKLPQYQVFEKNIDHLSYMLESKAEGEEKKFSPSVSKKGNITGNEFPAKVWSLTYDDGPKKETSPIILTELKKRGLIATFFQLTKEAQKYPEVAHMIRQAGMEIASHSYSHQQLTKVGPQGLEREISGAVRDLKKLHARELKFYRLPYGAGVSTPNIRAKIAENGLIHVFWNIDTLDWMAQSPDKIVARTKALMKKTPRDAGVILFHDIHQRTAEASPQIMDYLKQDNRRVCTLEEIVTQMNEGQETVCPQK